MVRLRHRVTGVVVRVDEGLAGRLPGVWEPADKSKPARRSTKKTDPGGDEPSGED